jgi:hypothetical protein
VEGAPLSEYRRIYRPYHVFIITEHFLIVGLKPRRRKAVKVNFFCFVVRVLYSRYSLRLCGFSFLKGNLGSVTATNRCCCYQWTAKSVLEFGQATFEISVEVETANFPQEPCHHS